MKKCSQCGGDLPREVSEELPMMHLLEENEPAYWVERLYGRHPKKKGKVLVEGWVCRKFAAHPLARFIARLRKIDQVHLRWCDSDEWQKDNGHWVAPLAQWLEDEGWTIEPQAAAVRKSKLDLQMEGM